MEKLRQRCGIQRLGHVFLSMGNASGIAVKIPARVGEVGTELQRKARQDAHKIQIE